MKIYTKRSLVFGAALLLCSPAHAYNSMRTTRVERHALCTITTTTSTLNNVRCNGGSDGMLRANPSGGTMPYTYAWSPNGGTQDTASNLSAGTYTVTVTDAASCVATASVIVTQPPALYLTISPSDTVCTGTCSGALAVVKASGGMPPYSYFWSNGYSNTNITGLCTGSYTLTFTDANGCSVNASADVAVESSIPSFTVTPTLNNATCVGTLDGSILLNCSGPTAPFHYKWGNVYGDSSYNNINPGTYTVTISDINNSCDILTYTIGHNDTCGTISGYTFNDTNFNCTFNAGEPGLHYSYITISPGSYVVYPNSAGIYKQYAPYGSYALTQTNYPGNPFAACSATQFITLNSPSAYLNFADTSHTPVQDPMTTYLYTTPPVIGDTCTASFQLLNNGTDTSNGTAYFVIPDSIIFLSTTPPFSIHSKDTIYWNYSGLLPGDTLNYFIKCRIDTNPNLVYEGYYACETAGVTPIGIESNPQNDMRSWCEPYVVACDPNDKAVNPPGQGVNGYINTFDSILTYMIRFQNTGTAPAKNIYIVDTISSHLDISTLRVLGSSNTFSYTVTGNRVRFIFSNINLPDSIGNQEGSKGWIEYQVHQDKANNPGDIIHNTAYIYFDYNAPVVTNTTVNTLKIITSSPALYKAGNMSFYPNPASGIVYIDYSLYRSTNVRIQVIDLLGRTILNDEIGNRSSGKQLDVISVKSLSPGTYIIRLQTDDSSWNRKLIIMR